MSSAKPINRRIGSAKAGVRRPNTGGRNGSQASANQQKRQVVGQYMIGKTIGEGTFGKVKIAIHLPTGEKVAVKMLEKSKIKEPADIRRVNREIKILKKVRHPNVIQLYEVLDTPSSIYLIMENCDGGEMFDYIVAHRHVPEKQACKFFHQLLDGLEAIHMNEVTHRDLKPENLLLKLSPDGWVVKIVDFGLSNTHEGGKLLSTACGSPCYAAPEMIAGKSYVGPMADIWSCGVILFALVCGFLPFEDANTNALYQKILSGVCKPANWISLEVADLISKILEVDPEKRYRISDIRQHPWYCSVTDDEVPHDCISSEEAENSREEITRTLTDAGVEMQLVLDGLASNVCNSYTAMYHLLEQKAKNVLHKKRQQSQQFTLGSSDSPAVNSTGNNLQQPQVEKSTVQRPPGLDSNDRRADATSGGARHRANSQDREQGQGQPVSVSTAGAKGMRVARPPPAAAVKNAPPMNKIGAKPRPVIPKLAIPAAPKLAIVPEVVSKPGTNSSPNANLSMNMSAGTGIDDTSGNPVSVSQTARLPSSSVGKAEFASVIDGSQTSRAAPTVATTLLPTPSAAVPVPVENVDYVAAAASAIVSRVGTSDGDRPVTRRSRSRASRGTSRGGGGADDSMMSSRGAQSGLTGFLPPGSPGAEASGSVNRSDLGPAFGDMPGNGQLQEEEASFIPITITNLLEEKVVGVGTNSSLPSSNAATVVINPITMPSWKEEVSPASTMNNGNNNNNAFSPSARKNDQNRDRGDEIDEDDLFPRHSRSPRDKGRDLNQVQVLQPENLKIHPKIPQNIQRSVGSSSGGRRGKNLTAGSSKVTTTTTNTNINVNIHSSVPFSPGPPLTQNHHGNNGNGNGNGNGPVRLAPTHNNRMEMMMKSPYTKVNNNKPTGVTPTGGLNPLGSPNKKFVLASLN